MSRKAQNEYRGPTVAHLRILDVIRSVPRGRVLTYGEVARRAGLPGRARLVGFVLRTCPLAHDHPWHRIIGAGGRIAKVDDAGRREQRRRLMAEGVRVDARGRLAISN